MSEEERDDNRGRLRRGSESSDDSAYTDAGNGDQNEDGYVSDGDASSHGSQYSSESQDLNQLCVCETVLDSPIPENVQNSIVDDITKWVKRNYTDPDEEKYNPDIVLQGVQNVYFEEHNTVTVTMLILNDILDEDSGGIKKGDILEPRLSAFIKEKIERLNPSHSHTHPSM